MYFTASTGVPAIFGPPRTHIHQYHKYCFSKSSLGHGNQLNFMRDIYCREMPYGTTFYIRQIWTIQGLPPSSSQHVSSCLLRVTVQVIFTNRPLVAPAICVESVAQNRKAIKSWCHSVQGILASFNDRRMHSVLSVHQEFKQDPLTSCKTTSVQQFNRKVNTYTWLLQVMFLMLLLVVGCVYQGLGEQLINTSSACPVRTLLVGKFIWPLA